MRLHGVSIYRNPPSTSGDQTFTLAFVNHRRSGSTIELFDYTHFDTFATHRKTVQDQTLMNTPNDLVLVSPDAFYVTNDHFYNSGWKRLVEEYLQMPWSSVLHYDGNSLKVAARGLHYANGIVATPKQEIWVAESTGFQLTLFLRKRSGGLQRQMVVPLDFL